MQGHSIPSPLADKRHSEAPAWSSPIREQTQGGSQTGGPAGRPRCVTEPEAVPGMMPVPGDGSGREPGGTAFLPVGTQSPRLSPAAEEGALPAVVVTAYPPEK